MESTINKSKAQLAQEQTELIAELTARAEAAESALASMPAPIANIDKLGWFRIELDWNGSTTVPTPCEDVAVLLVPNMSFNDNTKSLAGLLADFTKSVNTTPLTFEEAEAEIISGLSMRVDKAKALATGETDPAALASHAPDFSKKGQADGGGFKSSGTISLAS
jgi:hypothetical protein